MLGFADTFSNGPSGLHKEKSQIEAQLKTKDAELQKQVGCAGFLFAGAFRKGKNGKLDEH